MIRKKMKIYYDDINDLSKHINHYDYDKLLDDPLYCKVVLACSDNDVEYSSKHYHSIKEVYKFKDTKTIISPRLSYNHNLDNISIFGNISHGFSSPNIDETLDENGTVNPDIKPETGWNYELGLIGSTNDNSLSYKLNLYYMDIKNLLVAQRTSFDTFTGVNAGKTTHPGLEATINFPLLRSQNLNITSSNNFSPCLVPIIFIFDLELNIFFKTLASW